MTASVAESSKRNLSNSIANEVAGGYRVESQGPDQAVLVRGKRLSHLLHLFLTIITLGWWAIVWIALGIINRERRLILRLDDYGNVLRNEV